MNSRGSATSDPLLLLRWRDLVAVVDDGRRSAPAYQALASFSAALKVEHPRGYGMLIIIPQNARPPSEPARRAISEALTAGAGGLSCLCWLVEGKGFQAATVRAVLTGVRTFQGFPFETSVKSDLTEALTWILERVRRPAAASDAEIAAARESFCKQRSE